MGESNVVDKSGTTSDRLHERVNRERVAHTEQDVLAESFRLKDRFFHVYTAPSQQRMERAIEKSLEGIAGQRVLDLGCGRGEHSIALLERGASVVGIDISEDYVRHASSLAEEAGFAADRFSFQTMDAHALTFPDNSFDLVVGRGILHHLELHLALAEIWRVLKPTGRCLFSEPLGDNPLLWLFRKLTPSARTDDERPLSRGDLAQVARSWQVESTYYGLVCAPTAVFTSIVLRPFPNNVLLAWADRLERWLTRFHSLDSMHQYVLLNLVKAPTGGRQSRQPGSNSGGGDTVPPRSWPSPRCRSRC